MEQSFRLTTDTPEQRMIKDLTKQVQELQQAVATQAILLVGYEDMQKELGEKADLIVKLTARVKTLKDEVTDSKR